MPGINPADGDLVQTRCVSFTAGQISENIMHWVALSHTGAGTSLGALAASLDVSVHSQYQALMPATASWRGVGAQNLKFPRSVEQFSIANAGAGTAVGNLIPTQVSCLIQFRTVQAGRAFRGRIYPGLIASSLQDGTGAFTAAGLVLLGNLAVAIGVTRVAGAGLNTTTYSLVIKHPDVNTGPGQIQVYTPVVTIASSPLFATQRRRGNFGRQNVLPF